MFRHKFGLILSIKQSPFMGILYQNHKEMGLIRIGGDNGYNLTKKLHKTIRYFVLINYMGLDYNVCLSSDDKRFEIIKLKSVSGKITNSVSTNFTPPEKPFI